MFTIGYCIDDKIIITPDAICPVCGNKISECTCGEKCPDCGYKIDECICPKCPVCGEKETECTCPKCPDCGYKIDECICEKCSVCGNKVSACTCEKCPDCEHKIDECICEKCPDCEHKIDECICPKCPDCEHKIDECTCPKCPVCGEKETVCTCEKCSVCGKLIDECICDSDPDPEPVPPPPPPFDPDDPEAKYHRYTLEIALSRTNLNFNTHNQYTNYIGTVEVEETYYNEETGTTEIDSFKQPEKPVSCPDVDAIYKDYYKFYTEKIVGNDGPITVPTKFDEIHLYFLDFEGGQLPADFYIDPYWTLPKFNVKAKTNTDSPYDINEFTYDRSISISETCLNSDYFKDNDSEPRSMTLNYVSIRISENTIYITYYGPWKKGLYGA